MFSIKIFHFLKGYVILLLTGNNKEEFLNEILALGIKPENMSVCSSGIRFHITVADYLKLKKSVSDENYTAEEKHGAVFIAEKLKKRKAFLIGMALFLTFFAAGSRFIWSVDYDCSASCNIEQLRNAAEIAGIKAGVPKRKLKSGLEMKNIILNNTDNISWCWVYIKGTKAVVKVRENIIPPEIFNPDAPCDIIAMRSGIIKRVITKRGRVRVQENQAVAPGDVIISGTYDFENEPGYQVHSKGIAEAYTEHTKTGTYKQFYCYKQFTGRKRNLLSLKIYKWELPLYAKGDIKFKEYDSAENNYDMHIGGYYTGIGVRVRSFAEYITHKEPIAYDVCAELAKRELEKEISAELLPPAQLVDKKADIKKVDDETLSVTVTMTFIEQIGTEKQIEEVNFIEPKTDRSAAGD